MTSANYRSALVALAQLDKSDLKIALRKILEVVAATLDVDRVSFWELQTDHSAIHNRVLYQQSAGTFVEGGVLHATDFPAYFEAMLSTRTIVAHDAWTHPHTAELAEVYFRPNGITSMLDVPVWRRGQLAGVVCHEQVGTARVWSTEEQDFALAIGNMVSVALEATDRRRAEEGYAMVAIATNDVLWDWDLATGRLDFNDHLATGFRLRPEQITNTIAWWLEQVHVDDRDALQASIREVIRSNRTSWKAQYRWMRGDGTIATVMDRGFISRDERCTAVRMIGSMLDISDRVEMEHRLALSDRMASIGTLATGVAHEINNPLTYILANVESAIEDLRSGSTHVAQVIDLLSEAQDGAERVRRVVRDLQTFARPREDDLENIEPYLVLDSSVNMAWNQIRHRAQLVKEYGAIPKVRVNRARLGQVILNLLVNAAQAIPEGDVNRHHIRVRTRTDAAGRAVIEVIDTGCGIGPEIRKRIFEPFFTTKPVGVGTGLGLSICHSIITAQGGSIEIESPPEGGCLVRVTLPAAIEDVPATIEVAAPPPPRRCVLVVEDEPLVRKVLRRMLEPAHELVLAESGEEALVRLRSNPHMDVILCDLMMPQMTGMELHQRLLEEAPELAERMVFMTGGAFSQGAHEFLASSEHVLLHKPLDKKALLGAISAVGG
ncbi:MAG: ATP-binding protein [Myxococcota bacterium]|nr:ATP-binding protein [Myxococcota bacterium]